MVIGLLLHPPAMPALDPHVAFALIQSHADIAVEARAARNAAVVLDQSYFGKFYLTGPDANKVLQTSKFRLAALPMALPYLYGSR